MLKILRNSTAIIFLTMFVVVACNRPSNVFNERKMANLITEMHKADGLLSALRMQGKYAGDSLTEKLYLSVLQNFKITQADFDSSLVWYSKNPKRFEAVYVRVDRNLQKWKKDVERGKFGMDSTTAATSTIWQKNEIATYCDTEGYAMLDFDTPSGGFLPYDIYTLRFLQRTVQDTLANAPFAVLKINYSEGTTDSIIALLAPDGLKRRYTLRLKAKRMERIASVSGEMFVPDSTSRNLIATFDSISLTRTYDQLAQDSLQHKISNLRSTPRENSLLFQRKMPR